MRKLPAPPLTPSVVDNRLEVAIFQDTTSSNSEAEVPVPEPVKVPETKAEEPTVPEVTAKEIADEVFNESENPADSSYSFQSILRHVP
ncbi:hypothetical protein K4K59_002241 [Colletotrichum sp. SAR11_240]|nr:hypothetical protein K4K59_002241 [Colletotrichum sp. SAR11_240]